jgi:cyclopropane fatty-acyl-phospholipid synthase-like methyltransferase
MHAMHTGEGMHHRFDDPALWAQRFDHPDRNTWQHPEEVIRALALAEDAKVADIGAGTGYFTVRLARAVPKGVVYGVDVEPTMAKYIEDRAEKEGLTNVRGVVAASEDAKLPERVDVILVVDTYHHLSHRPAYFRKLLGSLTSGGRIAIIDFRRGQRMGPPDAHKIPADQVKSEMGDAGYRLETEHLFLPNQHFLVFAKR